MELYEALKSGTSSEELLAAFNKELSAAQAKLKEDEKKAKAKETEKKYLEDCRKNAAEAILKYTKACLSNIQDLKSTEKEDNYIIQTILTSLNNYEKELKKITEIDTLFQKYFNSKTSSALKESSFYDDEATIRNFIRENL